MTLEYMQQRRQADDVKNAAFFDAKVVTRADVTAAIGFASAIGKQLAASSRRAVIDHLKKGAVSVTGELSKAIDMLDDWDDNATPNRPLRPRGADGG